MKVSDETIRKVKAVSDIVSDENGDLYAVSDTPKETTIKLESLTVMNLKPDDILVFKVEKMLSTPEEIEAYLKNKCGIENKVMVIYNTDEIAAIRKEE